MNPNTIQILSDLHLETPQSYDIFDFSPAAKHLALLGDIGYTVHEGLFNFIKEQLMRFETVFFLLGNHEPYQSSWESARLSIQAFKQRLEVETKADDKLGQFVFLDQTRHDLSDEVTVLGCTLHSNITKDQFERVSFGLNDFYRIDDWTVERHIEAHVADVKWLNEQVSLLDKLEPYRRVIILSHHSPTIDARSISSKNADSQLSSGFMTDMSGESCWQSLNVKAWAFGHVHHNCDYVDPVTQKIVMTNQRGYYFAQCKGFDTAKVISI